MFSSEAPEPAVSARIAVTERRGLRCHPRVLHIRYHASYQPCIVMWGYNLGYVCCFDDYRISSIVVLGEATLKLYIYIQCHA